MVDAVSCVKPPIKPKPGSIKVYRAKYPFTATNEDELSFDEGDLLYVSGQSGEWFKARNSTGQIGLVPQNYISEKSEELVEPLHDATRRGNLDLVKTYVEEGVSLTGLDASGNTVLHWAAHAGHLPILQYLLQKSSSLPVNVQNNFGDTPLHLASSRGHLAIVEKLLECPTDVGLNIKNSQGETAIDLASNQAIKNCLQKHAKNFLLNEEAYCPESDSEDEE